MAPFRRSRSTRRPLAKTSHAVGPKHADGAFARLRGISFGRPLAIAASVLTAFVVLLGGAVWMSQKALPGDTLYGLKRASESFQLWTDGGDRTAKAKDYLNFAQTRSEEAISLAHRASASAMGSGVLAGTIDAHTADLISSTLTSADDDVRNATSLLGKEAVASKSSSPLKILTDWAPSQLARLDALADVIPAGTLQHRAQSSAWLVSAAANRAKALAPVVANGCALATSDALGPDPLGGCATPTTVTPTTIDAGEQQAERADPHRRRPEHRAGRHSGDAGQHVRPGPAAPVVPASPSKSPIKLPTLPTLPTLPPLPTLPIGSCGIHADPRPAADQPRLLQERPLSLRSSTAASL